MGKGPRCPLPQYPCVANLDGRCTILSDTTFTYRSCPFRKTKWETEAQMQRVADRLKKLDEQTKEIKK